jgi:hypothetical protein
MQRVITPVLIALLTVSLLIFDLSVYLKISGLMSRTLKFKTLLQSAIDSLTTPVGKIVTGGLVGSVPLVTTVTPQPNFLGQLLSYTVPFVLSTLSHLLLNLINKKRNANSKNSPD